MLEYDAEQVVYALGCRVHNADHGPQGFPGLFPPHPPSAVRGSLPTLEDLLVRCPYLLILAVLLACSGGEKLLFEDSPTVPDRPYRKLTLDFLLQSIDGNSLPITIDSVFCDDGTVAKERLSRVSFEPESTHSNPKKPDVLAVRADLNTHLCNGGSYTGITYHGTYLARQDSIIVSWPTVEVVKSGAWVGEGYMAFSAEVDVAGVKGMGTFRR